MVGDSLWCEIGFIDDARAAVQNGAKIHSALLWSHNHNHKHNHNHNQRQPNPPLPMTMISLRNLSTEMDSISAFLPRPTSTFKCSMATRPFAERGHATTLHQQASIILTMIATAFAFLCLIVRPTQALRRIRRRIPRAWSLFLLKEPPRH
ncbi:hypothetical protein BCR44DRAFT_1286910 [Catenaria anguillulae PL171]|uniref:Uncharacterized protein n=1 Tax=Catenaria anguillulae PL171 TaxID=765915 RepID=A0A1Y2H8R0_9FUNG|nr:hypothetical protein BCR44DRAFT_1286910 [Catenaria anguillulae PL171]